MQEPNPDWLCFCGTQFLSFNSYSAHRMKGKFACQGESLAERIESLHIDFPESAQAHNFDSFDGDLKHKQDLRLYGLEPASALYASLITNENQGKYIRTFYPELVPSGSPSDHTLGSIFEAKYCKDIVFRSRYIVQLHCGYK